MRFAIFVYLWMLMASAMADDLKPIQLQLCMDGQAKCNKQYQAGPSFFMQTSCMQMLAYLKQHHSRLTGRCTTARPQSSPHLSGRGPAPHIRH